MLRHAGFFDVIVRQSAANNFVIDFPLFFFDEYAYSGKDYLDRQDSELVRSIRNALELIDAPTTLIDCGADIGLIAAFCSHDSPTVTSVIAIEPNSEVFQILEVNLSRLAAETKCYSVALSSFTGFGVLRSPLHDSSFHARYISQVPEGEEGAIRVVRLDDLDIGDPGHVIFKIDVEGAEFDVIRGALETLKSANGFTVIFEAHPIQIRRTGLDPCAIIAFLNDICPIHHVVIGDPTKTLDLAKPYLSQLDRYVNRDIFCTTHRHMYESARERGIAPFVTV